MQQVGMASGRPGRGRLGAAYDERIRSPDSRRIRHWPHHPEPAGGAARPEPRHGRADADGRLTLHLNYDFREGVELANGMVFDRETRREADLLLAPGAADGEPRPVDIGLGPMFIRLNRRAEPA